jgi:hypothetical protein
MCKPPFGSSRFLCYCSLKKGRLGKRLGLLIERFAHGAGTKAYGKVFPG